jgi:hypothetical protein
MSEAESKTMVDTSDEFAEYRRRSTGENKRSLNTSEFNIMDIRRILEAPEGADLTAILNASQ